MLKACLDCIAGDQQRQSDDRYSAQMNGRSNSVPWPTFNAQNGKMFAVPTQLQVNDEIIVRGIMDDGMVDIALRPDENQFNIVSQINVVYPYKQPHDQITLRNVVNGNNNTINQDYKATDYFNDTTFDVKFIMMSNAIRISVGESYLDSVQLEHKMDDIRFISVIGQVNELNFRFKAY